MYSQEQIRKPKKLMGHQSPLELRLYTDRVLRAVVRNISKGKTYTYSGGKVDNEVNLRTTNQQHWNATNSAIVLRTNSKWTNKRSIYNLAHLDTNARKISCAAYELLASTNKPRKVLVVQLGGLFSQIMSFIFEQRPIQCLTICGAMIH